MDKQTNTKSWLLNFIYETFLAKNQQQAMNDHPPPSNMLHKHIDMIEGPNPTLTISILTSYNDLIEIAQLVRTETRLKKLRVSSIRQKEEYFNGAKEIQGWVQLTKALEYNNETSIDEIWFTDTVLVPDVVNVITNAFRQHTIRVSKLYLSNNHSSLVINLLNSIRHHPTIKNLRIRNYFYHSVSAFYKNNKCSNNESSSINRKHG